MALADGLILSRARVRRRVKQRSRAGDLLAQRELLRSAPSSLSSCARMAGSDAPQLVASSADSSSSAGVSEISIESAGLAGRPFVCAFSGSFGLPGKDAAEPTRSLRRLPSGALPITAVWSRRPSRFAWATDEVGMIIAV